MFYRFKSLTINFAPYAVVRKQYSHRQVNCECLIVFKIFFNYLRKKKDFKYIYPNKKLMSRH